MENFELFWELFNPDPEFNNRQRACRSLWEQKGEQRQAILEFLKSGKPRSSRNPYYFLADFRVRPPQVLSYADYYAKFGTTESQDGWVRKHIPEEQRTVYVKQSS